MEISNTTTTIDGELNTLIPTMFGNNYLEKLCKVLSSEEQKKLINLGFYIRSRLMKSKEGSFYSLTHMTVYDKPFIYLLKEKDKKIGIEYIKLYQKAEKKYKEGKNIIDANKENINQKVNRIHQT